MLNGKPSSEKVNSRPFPSSSSCSLQITVPGSGALLLWFQAIQKPRESIEPTDLNSSAFGTGQRVVLIEVFQEFPLLGFRTSCEFQFTFRTTEKRFFFRFLSCVVFLCGRGQMIVLYRVYNSSISWKYQYQLTRTPIQMIRLMIIHFLVHIFSNTLQCSSETEICFFKKKRIQPSWTWKTEL